MRLFVASSKGFWVTAYTVCLAEDQTDAERRINARLAAEGLEPMGDNDTLAELPFEPGAITIFNGDC